MLPSHFCFFSDGLILPLAHPSAVAFAFAMIRKPLLCVKDAVFPRVYVLHIFPGIFVLGVFTVPTHVLKFCVVKSNCPFMVSEFQVLGECPLPLLEEESLCFLLTLSRIA